MKKTRLWFLGAIILVVVIGTGVWIWRNKTEKNPPVTYPPSQGGTVTSTGTPQLPEGVNHTDFPLAVPKGFSIAVFAKDLPGARAMAMDGLGNLWVSQTGEGTVSMVETQTGKVNKIFRGLGRPHGLAVDPENGTLLYIAEETKISRVALYSEDTLHKIADLPAGGRHFTRSLRFGPDGRLYVSIGSTCDACNEQDERIAAIYSMNKDGSDMKKVASGLRNSPFFDFSYIDGKMWATEMGRDNLGDNLPPDEINVIDPSGFSARSGQHPPDFGWPLCYGQNIHDTEFDKNTYIQDPCSDTIPAKIDLPAHSAPLGLAFVPEDPPGSGWPEEYWHDLIVAFHGSWNRSQPTGYKLARIRLDDKGNVAGLEDFITGWLAADGKTSLGRPVDVLIQPGGTMYVTDDKAGVVYKIAYFGNMISSVDNTMRIHAPKENGEISSPAIVEGEAIGMWYFEASFPVQVVDANWKVLGEGVAQAQGEWMTQKKVPFRATVNFSKPTTGTGWLVLKKDNPSGLPENSAEYHFPIKFK